ncbi:MAG: hypothetical protein R3251_03395 [Candidatus Spechtbacterales bacterium]|nr:hypothetical protein [Candidatus Spechtbacterales bacterium]
MNNQDNNQVLLPHAPQNSKSFEADFAATMPEAQASELSGPNFSEAKDEVEKAKSSGWGNKIGNLFTENKSGWMAAGIVLVSIIGGLILANALDTGPAETLQAGLTAADNNSAMVAETTPATNASFATTEAGAITGEATFTAQNGEGVTHLARKAVAQFATATGTELSAEQKLYAEDYLKDIKGSFLLEAGDEVTFTAAEVEEAVNEALALEAWEIENLSQFTQNVQL